MCSYFHILVSILYADNFLGMGLGWPKLRITRYFRLSYILNVYYVLRYHQNSMVGFRLTPDTLYFTYTYMWYYIILCIFVADYGY